MPDLNQDTGGAEQALYALIALLNDKKGFADRLAQYTTAKADAEARLKEADAREVDLIQREAAATALKAQAEDQLATYNRGSAANEIRAKELANLQEDLNAAHEKMAVDLAAARAELDAREADLKKITDGLEERERLAAQVHDEGTRLAGEYRVKLDQLKSLAAG